MASGCTLICLEDFVLRILSDRTEIRDKYEKLMFKDCVESHSQLRFCSGVNCHVVIKTRCQKAKKVTCTSCGISFWYVPSLSSKNLIDVVCHYMQDRISMALVYTSRLSELFLGLEESNF